MSIEAVPAAAKYDPSIYGEELAGYLEEHDKAIKVILEKIGGHIRNTKMRLLL